MTPDEKAMSIWREASTASAGTYCGDAECPDCKAAAAVIRKAIDEAVAERDAALCFLGKWIERGLFDKNVTAKEALGVMAHLPGMPWNSERWDVDHKPYAAEYYKRFPKTAALGAAHD